LRPPEFESGLQAVQFTEKFFELSIETPSLSDKPSYTTAPGICLKMLFISFLEECLVRLHFKFFEIKFYLA